MLPDWFWLCVLLFGAAVGLAGLILAGALAWLTARERLAKLHSAGASMPTISEGVTTPAGAAASPAG